MSPDENSPPPPARPLSRGRRLLNRIAAAFLVMMAVLAWYIGMFSYHCWNRQNPWQRKQNPLIVELPPVLFMPLWYYGRTDLPGADTLATIAIYSSHGGQLSWDVAHLMMKKSRERERDLPPPPLIRPPRPRRPSG